MSYSEHAQEPIDTWCNQVLIGESLLLLPLCLCVSVVNPSSGFRIDYEHPPSHKATARQASTSLRSPSYAEAGDDD